MKYEDFKCEVINKLRDFYGSDAMVEVQSVKQLNGIGYEGVCVRKVGEAGVPTPVISLNDLYAMFGGEHNGIDECIDKTVRMIEDNTRIDLPQGTTFEELISWENVKEQIFPVLISKKENKELLKTLASTDFLDLAVIFVIRGLELKAGIGHIKVTKDLLKRWGISLEMLHKQALFNLRKDGYGFENILSVLVGMLRQDSASDAKTDHLEPGNIYVYSNLGRLFGAAGILDEVTLADCLGNESYYILPFSIHETMFVRKESNDEHKELADIVREINQTQVEVADKLSDRIYFYNGKTGKVEMCA